MNSRRCVIIPGYNEANNIRSVIGDIRRYHPGDIVVVDDGSGDATSALAREAGAFVIRHPFNMGYGVALQTGYKYAVQKGYDTLVQIDGDGQHGARFIPELFRMVEAGECDVAIGSRFQAASGYRFGLLKTAGVRLFRQLIRLLTGERITDPTSGYQCLNRRAFAFLTGDLFPCDYPDANVIIMLHRAGFTIKEVPVEMVPNREGRSMHRGILTIGYYCFTMFLSIFVTVLRKR